MSVNCNAVYNHQSLDEEVFFSKFFRFSQRTMNFYRHPENRVDFIKFQHYIWQLQLLFVYTL